MSTFNPLQTMPAAVSDMRRQRWERLASKADRSYRAAVELKCLECCAWQRSEAQRCELTGCPLHAMNQRIFRSRAGAAGGDEDEGTER